MSVKEYQAQLDKLIGYMKEIGQKNPDEDTWPKYAQALRAAKAALVPPVRYGVVDPETEEVATDIVAMCEQPLLDWLSANPVAAARLLGFDVVELPEDEKPLDGLAEQIAAVCGDFAKALEEDLSGVPDVVREIMNSPTAPQPVLTKKEMALCQALGACWVTRNRPKSSFSPDPEVELWSARPSYSDILRSYLSTPGARPIASINPQLFPSVAPGDCIQAESADGDTP